MPPSKKYIANAVRVIETRLNHASNSGENWAFYHGDEWDELAFKANLEDAWTLLVDLVERLGHTEFLEAVRSDYEECKEKPTASAMGPDEPYLVWTGYCSNYLGIIKDIYLYEPPKTFDSAELTQLIELVRNSEYHISSRNAFGWVPLREEDVHQRLEGVLKCSYPDLISKPPIAKPIKGFVPDSGIPSLGALLEYKFIESEEYAKTVVDQMLADIGGYQCDGYGFFVFVIYETSRLFSESDWKAAVSAAKPRNPIEVVILRGTPPTDVDRKISDDAAKARKPRVARKSTKKPAQNKALDTKT